MNFSLSIPNPEAWIINHKDELEINWSDKAVSLHLNKESSFNLYLLDDEITNKMPLDIVEVSKKDFLNRLENINWETYYKDLHFNSSALSLYKWAPIADELKTLDRKIVLNSVILKWDVVKKEFGERLKF